MERRTANEETASLYHANKKELLDILSFWICSRDDLKQLPRVQRAFGKMESEICSEDRIEKKI